MPDRERGTVPGSVGRAMPNTELKLVDGELWVRGPQSRLGPRRDADGWLHTGDAGRIDADGNVFIVDRLKELIKVSGYQVAPAELEAVLAAPSRRRRRRRHRPPGRAPRRGPGGDRRRGGRRSRRRSCSPGLGERVAPYKRPHAVRFADAIPRTPSGKVLRRVLRDREPAIVG